MKQWCITLDYLPGVKITDCIATFQCFGIVSLLAAMTAYSDHKAQDYAGEQRKRNIARGFGIAAIVIGCVGIVTLIIVQVVIVALAVNSNPASHYYNYNNYGK